MTYTAVCDCEELDILESRLKKFKERAVDLKEEFSICQGNLCALNNQLTNGEIEEKIELLNDNIERNKVGISKIETGELFIEEEINKINIKLIQSGKVEQERRSLFDNMVDVLTENLNRKKKDFFEEV